MRSFGRTRGAWAVVALVVTLVPRSMVAQSSQAADLYQEARAREVELRKLSRLTPVASASANDVHNRMRTLSRTYEDLWRLFPTSAYSDDALWYGAMLAGDAFRQFGDAGDRTIALRLFQALTTNFPTSSLLKRVPAEVARLQAVAAPVPPAQPATAPSPASASARNRGDGTASDGAIPASRPAAPAAGATSPSVLTAIRRDVLPDALRVTFELDREPVFSSERIDGPPRVFVDLENTRAAAAVRDVSLPFTDDVVRQIRVGRQLNGRTRIVLDLAGAGRYSVYSLYNPYRIVVDFERKSPVADPTQRAATAPPAETRKAASTQPNLPPTSTESTKTLPSTAAPAPVAATPTPPAANSGGSFSLSRQLGLGVARIVIDPGHGGHDPGAQVKGLNEADLTLDIALRLEKLLAKQAGVQVILTRRDDTFVALQERTAVANRAGADLFLSIHANASEDVALRGIETYFLNLSPNPEAGRIAARENATSSKTMHDFSDIVKAIALNDKIDESRDFATIVQSSLYDKLRLQNKDVRNLGVKQAPFMVLVGATMPSILAEVSFITNRQEGSLLKSEKYRQQIAEALYQGVMRYQQSLKKTPAMASATTR